MVIFIWLLGKGKAKEIPKSSISSRVLGTEQVQTVNSTQTEPGTEAHLKGFSGYQQCEPRHSQAAAVALLADYWQQSALHQQGILRSRLLTSAPGGCWNTLTRYQVCLHSGSLFLCLQSKGCAVPQRSFLLLRSWVPWPRGSSPVFDNDYHDNRYAVKSQMTDVELKKNMTLLMRTWGKPDLMDS